MTGKRSLTVGLLGVGSSPHLHRIAVGLIERGHSVHIITPAKHGPFPALQGVTFHPFGADGTGGVGKLQEVRAILAKVQPDVLHSHYVSHGGIIGVASGYHPHLMQSWGCDVLNDPQISRMHWVKTKLALRAADWLLPLSSQLHAEMIKISGRKHQYDVFQWGIDTRHYSPECDHAGFRKRLGLTDEPLVYSPRTIEPHYNHDVLVKAWPEIKRKFPRAKLMFLSSMRQEPYNTELKELVRGTGIENDVIWLNGLSYDDMPKAYAASDVVVSIPASDGLGMTVLEALACARPVVVSDLPPYREWVKPETNGILVDLQESNAVGQAIGRVLGMSPQERQAMERANREAAAEADYRKRLETLERIYLKVAESRGRGFSWLKTCNNMLGLWR